MKSFEIARLKQQFQSIIGSVWWRDHDLSGFPEGLPKCLAIWSVSKSRRCSFVLGSGGDFKQARLVITAEFAESVLY